MNPMLQLAFGGGNPSPRSTHNVAAHPDACQGLFEHAACLGIDPAVDFDLLWIAEMSLQTVLPPQWVVLTTPTGQVYYYDTKSATSTWEHPCDRYYKEMVHAQKAGAEGTNKSAQSSLKVSAPARRHHILTSLQQFLRDLQMQEEGLTDPGFTKKDLAKMITEIDGIIGPFRDTFGERGLDAVDEDMTCAKQKEQLDAALEEVDVLKRSSIELEERVEKLASRNRELQSQVSRYESSDCCDKAARGLQVQQLESRIAEQKSEIEKLNENRCRAQEESKARIEFLEKTKNQLRKEKDEADASLSDTRRRLADLSDEAKCLHDERSELEVEVAKLSGDVEISTKAKDDALVEAAHCKTIANAAEERALKADANSKAWEDRYREERKRSNALNNRVIELQGNIRVLCRIRPLSDSEEREAMLTDGVDLRQAIQYVDDGKLLFHGTEFFFDRVFGPKAVQGSVYSEIASAVASCMDGHKVCIFAFGQTGSGKTFTMEGTKDDRGMNARALSDLFALVKSSADFKYSISVSVVEVYNDSIYDLLVRQSKSGRGNGLEIHMRKEDVHVDGLQERKVTSSDEIEQIIQVASGNRVTASNNVNEHSSRSHLVLSVKIDGENLNTGIKSRGKLHLVDLAGSERLKNTTAHGQRLKEAQSINRSLSALGDVIGALDSRKKHVPYRNSKLTSLLQDSLRPNARVLMFVNINPTIKSVGESKCSLKFASRCRAVRLGRAERYAIST